MARARAMRRPEKRARHGEGVMVVYAPEPRR
jgi:hypothetical protein